MKTYKNNESSNELFSGSKFGGVDISIEAIADLVNTALVGSDTDLEEATIVVTLNRMINGEMVEFTIIDANLAPIFVASGVLSANIKCSSPSNAATNANYLLEVVAGAAAKEIGLRNVRIPFGGVIDTTEGGGQLNVQISVGKSFFSTNTNVNLSTVTVDLYSTEGVEEFIPKIDIKVIPAGEVAPEYTATGIIKALMLVNLNSTGVLASDAIATQVNISTETFTRTRTYAQLLEDRGNENYATEIFNLMAQTFELIPFRTTKFYSKVKVRPTLVSAKILSGKNWYCCWRGVASSSSLAMGIKATAQNTTTVKNVFGTALQELKVNNNSL